MRITKSRMFSATLALVSWVLFAGFYQGAYKARWVILKDCSVKVNGSTNVNKFSCSINGYPNSDTLAFSNNAAMPLAMAGKLALSVSSFDCNNAMMTSDLRKTLKAKEFPHLRITFVSLDKYPALQANPERIKGIVNIELAGVNKRTEVNYSVSADNQKIIHLIGTQTVLFSDFNLTPPRKLGGMIRANNELDVEFRINFRVVP
ncbi:YceI family protein [Filimonas effusa]|uniref:YceI family protein n=1 Tax=Filimonas effusa TaxID=2508721 RepID=A0A4Q1DBW5_9BACT|nr:YceI family protein [Filimonas effusa]RXK86937.1 YceI family protein [Filimonas effusa]